MGLSELTNRELKNILRQNNVKNFSKLNKKDLVKKVNKLLNSQNSGNSNKMINKKYTLKELIGGNGELEENPVGPSAPPINEKNEKLGKNTAEQNTAKNVHNNKNTITNQCGACIIL
jgi:hypothetical protein